MTTGLRVPCNTTAPGAINPSMTGISESSCKSMPGTGWPCELLTHSKQNPICENCTVRMGRDYINSTRQERKDMVIALNGRESLVSKGAYKDRKREATCKFIGCHEKCYSNYCLYHARVVGSRKGLWKRGNKNWPPEKWHTVPVRVKK